VHSLITPRNHRHAHQIQRSTKIQTETIDERGARSLYRINRLKSQEPRDKKGIEGGELDGGSTAARCWLWLCFGSGCRITVAVQLDSYASASSSHCGVHQSSGMFSFFFCFFLSFPTPPFFFAFFSFLLSALFVVSSSSTTLLCCCFKFVNSWRSVCVCVVRGSCEIVEVFYSCLVKETRCIFRKLLYTLWFSWSTLSPLAVHSSMLYFWFKCCKCVIVLSERVTYTNRETQRERERERDTHTHTHIDRETDFLLVWKPGA